MFKIRTIKSKLIIRSKHFPKIVERLKRLLPNDKTIQNSRNVHELARKFGWRTLVDLKTYDINSLQFFGDDWGRNTNSALIIFSRFIEPGGFIHIANDKYQRYWVYKFDGEWFKKTVLTRVFVDLDSKEEVEDLFQKAVDAAIKRGITRKEMIEIIKENIVSEYLDV